MAFEVGEKHSDVVGHRRILGPILSRKPTEGNAVPRYMVERHLPGITNEQLTAAAKSAKTTTAEMSSEGTPVRYLRSTFVPREEKCFCLFEGESEEAVREANERAQIPFERIHEAEFVTSEDLG
jgi:hypothetical protein